MLAGTLTGRVGRSFGSLVLQGFVLCGDRAWSCKGAPLFIACMAGFLYAWLSCVSMAAFVVPWLVCPAWLEESVTCLLAGQAMLSCCVVPP
jgi:hypothetical protein